MTTLYIDTSSSYLYAGIMIDGQLKGEKKEKLDKELSSFTLPKIKEMLDQASLSPEMVDKILVVSGPGSFTGIRIGMTIAKTMAWALHKEISALSSLDAMALSVTGYDYVIPLIDARHEHVYGGIYKQDGTAVLEGSYLPLTDLLTKMESLTGKKVVVTNESIEVPCEIRAYDPDLLRIIHFFCGKKGTDPHLVNPTYLKASSAEEEREHDLRNQ